jgi:hypothetical protein
VPRVGFPLRSCLAVTAAATLAACRPPTPPAKSPEPVISPEEHAAEERRYEELTTRLAPAGEQALAGLTSAADPAHGAVSYQAPVAASGSTAYLRFVQLGQGGARAVRLVLRYEGTDWIDAGECSVTVDGATVGSFRPAKISAEKTSDGVVELLDVDADTIRPIMTALLEGQAAEIILRGAKGSTVIALDAAQLAAMQEVFAASLHVAPAQP